MTRRTGKTIRRTGRTAGRVESAPRWATLKWATNCVVCGAWRWAGERVLLVPRTAGLRVAMDNGVSRPIAGAACTSGGCAARVERWWAKRQFERPLAEPTDPAPHPLPADYA